MKFTIVSLAFLLISSFAAQAQITSPTEKEASTISKPELKVGDKWVFRRLDLWKNAEEEKYELQVTGLNGDNIELNRKIISSASDSTVGSSSTRKGDRATMTVINPATVAGAMVNFAFPLEVGKTWKYEFSRKPADGDLRVITRTAKVEGWEEVQVPAGKFKALKVVHSGNYARQSERGMRTGGSFVTIWYVPEIKWFVKYEYRDTTQTGKLWSHEGEELVMHEIK